MNAHETDAALSAHLDGEVSGSEVARIEAHLDSCGQCSARSSALKKAMLAVASLPEEVPTSDESRAIRLAVIQARASRRPAWQRWAALSGAAALFVGIVGTGAVLLRDGSTRNEPTSGLALDSAQRAGSEEVVFDSDDAVRDGVGALPELSGATGRYRVRDVGTQQAQALEGFASSPAFAESSEKAAGARGESKGAPARSSAADSTEVPLATCLKTILRSQPYSMMPVAARPAIYKGTPAWLLIYAFTSSTDEDASLDRIQAWLFPRTRCSPEDYLFYNSIKSPRG